MKASNIVVTLGILALLGCSSEKSNSSGPADAAAGANLTGIIAGGDFTARDAIVAETTTWKSGFYPGTSTVVLISDWPNLCKGIEARVTPKESRFVILDISEVSAGTAQPINNAGDYVRVTDYGDLSRAREFLPFYSHFDANCGFNDGDATSGTLNLTDGSQSSPKGTLNLTFDDGGHVSGSFSVSETCSGTAVDTYLNGNPSCS